MPEATPLTFCLSLYPGKKVRTEPEAEYRGTGEEWLEYQVVRVPGFDGSVTLKLEGFWQRALRAQGEDYSEVVTGRETIVKFGRTMQVKETFTVRLVAKYATPL